MPLLYDAHNKLFVLNCTVLTSVEASCCMCASLRAVPDGTQRTYHRTQLHCSATETGFSLSVRDGQSARSVRSLSLYTCDAPVHELGELKARPGFWRLLHSANLAPCQRELRVNLEPPVTATCIRVRSQFLNPDHECGHKGLPRCRLSAVAAPPVLFKDPTPFVADPS